MRHRDRAAGRTGGFVMAMKQQHDDANTLCNGEVCANCCLCEKCGRHVGTPHLDVCACPPDGRHWLCGKCLSKQIAYKLSRTADQPHDDGWRR